MLHVGDISPYTSSCFICVYCSYVALSVLFKVLICLNSFVVENEVLHMISKSSLAKCGEWQNEKSCSFSLSMVILVAALVGQIILSWGGDNGAVIYSFYILILVATEIFFL